jgi:hypothetical protein
MQWYAKSFLICVAVALLMSTTSLSQAQQAKSGPAKTDLEKAAGKTVESVKVPEPTLEVEKSTTTTSSPSSSFEVGKSTTTTVSPPAESKKTKTGTVSVGS